jgi:Holliday junction resolvasome RuvABC endonuclease subunit
MNPCAQVGKTAANWNPTFANWAQLANPCQLHSFRNQQLMPKLAKLAVGKTANLPTDANPHAYWVIGDIAVGENSPSYYVGEGTAVPSDLRGSVDADGRTARSTRLVVLALDLGTTTGWALRSRDGQIAHGFVNFKPQRFEGGGMRYLRFKRWLSEITGAVGEIHSVYFEEVRRHSGVDAAHVYGGLMATLTTWCEHHNVPYQGIPVGTIKKHATGKGNAGKAEVIASMRAKGHPVTDDNEADALALLGWAIDTQER